MIGTLLLWSGRIALFAAGGLMSALALARLARRGRDRPVPIRLPPPLLLVAALLFLFLPRVLQPLLPEATGCAGSRG